MVNDQRIRKERKYVKNRSSNEGPRGGGYHREVLVTKAKKSKYFIVFYSYIFKMKSYSMRAREKNLLVKIYQVHLTNCF